MFSDSTVKTVHFHQTFSLLRFFFLASLNMKHSFVIDKILNTTKNTASQVTAQTVNNISRRIINIHIYSSIQNNLKSLQRCIFLLSERCSAVLCIRKIFPQRARRPTSRKKRGLSGMVVRAEMAATEGKAHTNTKTRQLWNW